jgi:proteasome lid subunit RPN8/RPN11
MIRSPQNLLEIPRSIFEAMLDHARREAPLECCGLLGGKPPRVAKRYPLRNTEASPVRYNAEPRDLINAVVDLRRRDEEILAIYHSHPRHAPVPSQTDLRENHYGDVPRLIISLLSEPPEVRVWRLEADSFEDLPWRVVADAGPSIAVEPGPASG